MNEKKTMSKIVPYYPKLNIITQNTQFTLKSPFFLFLVLFIQFDEFIALTVGFSNYLLRLKWQLIHSDRVILVEIVAPFFENVPVAVFFDEFRRQSR